MAGPGEPLSEQFLPERPQLVGVGEAVDGRLVGGVVDAAVTLPAVNDGRRAVNVQGKLMCTRDIVKYSLQASTK